MKQHKFNLLFLATVATLSSQPAFAALNSYTHANGSTVVNINQPDANGLSHNMYQQFNVTADGLVLNNSPTDLIRERGDIARNSNLDKAASLILNEVISKSPSSLNGYIDVAGQKADVIIANPNGITCSGCSFINTGRATLTTGTPSFTDGVLTDFKVAKGILTIKGNGLKGADYTELLAQQINLQGEVKTSQLRAIAGTYTYNIAAGQATTTGSRQLRSNSIDVSALGGATAGLIQLQTTEAGAGVNNSGVLNATNLYIASNGALTNSGTLQAEGISAIASGSITNQGTLSARQTDLRTTKDFTNHGTLNTTDYTTVVSAGKFFNSGNAQVNAAGSINIVTLTGNVENKGSISTPQSLVMQTGYSTVDGVVTAVANSSLINSGAIQVGHLSMNAVKEVTLLAGGAVTAQGSAQISASYVSNATTLTAQNASVMANSFRNNGEIATTNLLNISGKNGIVNTGTLKAGTLALATDGKISNASCMLWVFCHKGTLSADKITIAAPKIHAISDLDGNYYTKELELNKPAATAEMTTRL